MSKSTCLLIYNAFNGDDADDNNNNNVDENGKYFLFAKQKQEGKKITDYLILSWQYLSFHRTHSAIDTFIDTDNLFKAKSYWRKNQIELIFVTFIPSFFFFFFFCLKTKLALYSFIYDEHKMDIICVFKYLHVNNYRNGYTHICTHRH